MSGLRVTFLPRGVADHPGEVADQEDHLVAQVLELPHLVEQHGVADVQVRRGRVEAGLDAQRAARLAGGRVQFLALEDLVGAAADQFKGVLQVWQGRGVQLMNSAQRSVTAE